jgi:uncharacterized membrane protein
MLFRVISAFAAGVLLASCGGEQDANVPGDTGDESAYSGIPEDAVIAVNGTEPFWGGRLAGCTFTYTTPENIDGVAIPVTRFAGRGGLSFSGQLDGQAVDLAITPGGCSDGMSDRTYPYNATLQLGREQRHGCASLDGNEPGER